MADRITELFIKEYEEEKAKAREFKLKARQRCLMELGALEDDLGLPRSVTPKHQLTVKPKLW